jgi:hypothetical protein
MTFGITKVSAVIAAAYPINLKCNTMQKYPRQGLFFSVFYYAFFTLTPVTNLHYFLFTPSN